MDTEQVFWPILAKKVAELSKLDSQFQWRVSGASLLQNLQIVILLNFGRKNFGWLSEKSQRGFQAAFYLSMGTTWRKFFLKSFCNFCGLFFGSFPVIEQEKFGRPVKTAFIVSIKSFWRKYCFAKQMKIFIILIQWAGSFWAFGRVFRREC